MCIEMASSRGKDWRGKECLNSQRCLANKADSNSMDLEVGLWTWKREQVDWRMDNRRRNFPSKGGWWSKRVPKLWIWIRASGYVDVSGSSGRIKFWQKRYFSFFLKLILVSRTCINKIVITDYVFVCFCSRKKSTFCEILYKQLMKQKPIKETKVTVHLPRDTLLIWLNPLEKRLLLK